jgi:hypothetical protein
MYSRKRISQNSFPNFFLYISKVIHDILSGTTRSQKELWKPDLNLGCHHEKNFTTWIWTLDPYICVKYYVRTIKADNQGSHLSILVPFRTNKDSFLPVTYTGLADLFPQLGSSHEQLCGTFMYLALVFQCQNTYNSCRGPGFESCVWILIFFSCWHPWETRFKSGFHSSFWDFIYGIWNWGMASSFHVIQISIRQDIFSQLWIVKIFTKNIYFL